MAYVCDVRLKGVSIYSQTKHVTDDGLGSERERPDEKEKRTWRQKMHTDKNGYVHIPPMALKNCLSSVAKYLGMKIPGQRNKTFTAKFESGVMVLEAPQIMVGGKPIKSEDVEGMWLFVPSDGVRGSGKRVDKCFPIIPVDWEADVQFFVLDETITEEVFKKHLAEAGMFTGIGYFRPERNGIWGRFEIIDFKWSKR